MDWLTTSWSTLGVLGLKAVGAYVALIAFVRIAGLRSFSKLSSFDFALTVALGSVLGTAVIARQPALAQVVFASAVLLAIRTLIAWARRWPVVSSLVDNSPLLLMAGPEVLEDNMSAAHVTHDDLAEKLREANVLDRRQVRAVVMETTGDIVVLTGEPDGPPLEPSIMLGVRDAERLFVRS